MFKKYPVINIMLNLRRILNAPHPLPGSYSPIKIIGLSIAVGCIISLLLYFFAGDIGLDFRWGTVGIVTCYGLVSTFVTLIFQMLIPAIFIPHLKDEDWNLWKDILYVMIMILCIAIANYFLTLILFSELESSISSFISILSSTFFIGIFPTVFFLTLSMLQNEKKYKKESQELIESNISIQERKPLLFKSEYAEANLEIDRLHFLFAESESNYVRFYFKDKDVVKSEMLRTTLKAVEEEITEEQLIIKTHRSFIINLGNALEYDGNSQGYIVFFEGTNKVARVSRSFTPKVRKCLQNIASYSSLS